MTRQWRCATTFIPSSKGQQQGGTNWMWESHDNVTRRSPGQWIALHDWVSRLLTELEYAWWGHWFNLQGRYLFRWLKTSKCGSMVQHVPERAWWAKCTTLRRQQLDDGNAGPALQRMRSKEGIKPRPVWLNNVKHQSPKATYAHYNPSLRATYMHNSWGTLRCGVFPLVWNKLVYREPQVNKMSLLSERQTSPYDWDNRANSQEWCNRLFNNSAYI
jgi:hypothetical protein